MIETQHAEMVRALVKPGAQIKEELTAEDADQIHAIMGIAGEAGELVDAVKKKTIYRKPLDRENIIEELGDMEFYMQQLRASVGVTREETLVANMAKLAVRYKNYQYSNDQAIARNDKVV